ncbi:hypothetical protein EZV62_024533 [Acer yangbiense]|uniref:30S ribosomal protein S17, chloroplastic n=1 Tax=Acer yangbiense TaxID=1000413 RepID=A0A5C7GVD1_9ROSI|nr:hypothetical protein EZV62_024533 [Acer yangbiense]
MGVSRRPLWIAFWSWWRDTEVAVEVVHLKIMQGRVVYATNDRMVAVEVVRLDPHLKYRRRVRKKKKYQAHDPDNKFKVGDVVQLDISKPISKTKSFLAVAVQPRTRSKKVEGAFAASGDAGELGSWDSFDFEMCLLWKDLEEGENERCL